MARRDKSSANVAAQPSVKLFVASTNRPYKPFWSPPSPTVLLTGGCAEPLKLLGPSGHICKRHSELICKLMSPEQEYDKVFLVDLSLVASAAEWRDELDAAGRATRMFYKWFSKFNPSAAKMVVHAEDASLISNMLQLHAATSLGQQTLIERVVLIGDKPPPKAVLQYLAEVAVVELVRPSLKAVAVAVNGMKEPMSSKKVVLADLIFVSVDFRLCPTNKQLLQTPQNITLDVTFRNDMSRGKHWQSSAAGADGAQRVPLETMAIDELDFGMRVEGLIVQVLECVEAGDVDLLTIGDPHGTIEALTPRSLSREVMMRGSIVSVVGRMVPLNGHLFLAVESATSSSEFRKDYTAVRIGQRNMSQRQHRCGVLVLRGSKCALARDEKGNLSIPAGEPCGSESKHQTAKSAFRHACRVSVEELAFLSDVPPAVAYSASGEKTTAAMGRDATQAAPPSLVLTVFAATATSSPPEDSGGCCGDCGPVDIEDKYDWYSFEEALRGLSSESERVCLMKVTQSLAEASYAGILIAGDHLSAFRPVTPALHNDLYFTQVLSLAWQEAETARKFTPQIAGTSQTTKKQGARKAKAGMCCGPGKCGIKGCC